MEERQLLAAAQGGDEDAYRRLVEPHRRELHAHCYRMLGSLQDAEDALQETLLGAWRGLHRFEGRSSLRTWLYTIAAHACARVIAQRPARVLPAVHGPAADPRADLAEPLTETVWLEPYPDELEDGRAAPEARYELRESVELAFVAALQRLPATQRAVLMGERLPERSQQATRRALGDEALHALVERFVGAWERKDVDAILGMLAEDARFTMPPLPTWFHGRRDIGVFITECVFALPWRFEARRANGQPAMACYQREGETCHLSTFNVLTLRGAQIEEITAFLAPQVVGRFDR